MMDDSMDRPPVGDFGADRYDYIEIDAPEGIIIPPDVLDLFAAKFAQPCPDCRANVFLKYVGHAADFQASVRFWQPTIAHDETCPTLAKLEREGRV